MNTTFAAKKMNLTESFTDHAEKKLEKLDRFFDSAEAQVKVSTVKDTARVEITVRNGGLIFRGESADKDKLNAFDKALDTIIRRIRKNKTKLLKAVKASAFEPAEEEIADEGYEVVRIKEPDLKAMTVEEAILQMNLLEHSFFLFENAENGNVNVVYRRNDDGYGLIAPKR